MRQWRLLRGCWEMVGNLCVVASLTVLVTQRHPCEAVHFSSCCFLEASMFGSERCSTAARNGAVAGVRVSEALLL